jgi:hypothetical protein
MARSNPAHRDVDARLDDDVADAMDVPAAVVCAVCGRCDCPGCTYEQTGTSGVVAIVPWERPTVPWFSRFFATVKATTQGAETFFFALPDGSAVPALLFAVMAEGFAVLSMAAFIPPLFVAVFPGLLSRLMAHASTRQIVLLAATIGIVGFTALLVGAHALHGVSLGKKSRRRAVRVGLYACGWDFGASPAGVLVAGLSGGIASAVSLLRASISAPRSGVDAALEGIFQVRGPAAARARRRAVWIAMVASVAALAVLLCLVAVTPLVVG